MNTLSLLLGVLLCSAVRADNLDALVKREQANVDNEAVVVYGGKVGTLDAIFHIEWAGTGNPVDGHYYYPSRGKRKSYILKGNNPKAGVLNLQEYTVDAAGKRKLTATCRLTKRLTGTRVIWEGQMNNTDGRV
ncbi:MAG: hypothetical protein HKN82_12060, partial [Akkermansiaceae bacterium]|nr:hypothetical protein [Akkermansiaceae bacterium]